MDDVQLIRYADSSVEAFIELYRRNITLVYCYHMAHTGNVKEAEDLTTQTFTGALEELRSFRKSGSFSAWILEIAVKKRLKDSRASRREHPHDAVLYYQSSGLPSDRTAMQRKENEAITHALKQLPVDQMQAVILRFFGDLTNSEISRILKRNADTIEMLISRGINNLHTPSSPDRNRGIMEGQKAQDLDFEDNALADRLSHIADQIIPDPLFVSELGHALATSYPPNSTWRLSLQKLGAVAGWVMLIGLGAFLINWRVTSNPLSDPPIATGSPTTYITKVVIKKITATPNIPTTSPTATSLLTLEYTVQAGDTCTDIADKYDVKIDRLVALNKLNSTCDLQIDQILVIPITPTATSSN